MDRGLKIRRALAAIGSSIWIANEIRGAIMAGPVLYALVRSWLA